MIRSILYLLISPVLAILDCVEEDKKANELNRLWEKQSFVFNGWRLNKDYYEIVDGKIVEKG